jgi:hypothetical protein
MSAACGLDCCAHKEPGRRNGYSLNEGASSHRRVLTQPSIDDAQRLGIQLADPCGAFVFCHDQTDVTQQAKTF